jgi:hypothetical protein
MKRPLADKVEQALISNKILNPEDCRMLEVTYDKETEELHVNRRLGWSSAILRNLLKVTDKFFLVFTIKDQHTIIIYRS